MDKKEKEHLSYTPVRRASGDISKITEIVRENMILKKGNDKLKYVLVGLVNLLNIVNCNEVNRLFFL